MLGLFVSLLVGGAVAAAVAIPQAVTTIWGIALWGVLAFIGTFIYVGRRANKKLEPLLQEAQKHIQAQRIEKAIETFEGGFKIAKWHPLLPGQIHAQIGMLLYITGDFDKAIPHLSRASRFVWPALAMAGCAFFKKKDEAKMRSAFERAVKSGKKDSLSWTVYAYCLREIGKKDEALALLERGAKRMKKADHRLSANIERLRENKPLKTAPYAEQWMQFRLDKGGPPMGKGPRGQNLDPNHPALRGLRGRRARHM